MRTACILVLCGLASQLVATAERISDEYQLEQSMDGLEEEDSVHNGTHRADTVTLLQFNMLAEGLATDGFMSPRMPRTLTPKIPAVSDTKHTFYDRVRDTVKALHEVRLSDIPRWRGDPKGAPKTMVKEALKDTSYRWGIKDMTGQRNAEAVNEAWVVGWDRVSNYGLTAEDAAEAENKKKLPGGRLWVQPEIRSHRGRLERIVEIVRARRPDIVTIQEMDMFSDVIMELSKLGYTAGPGVASYASMQTARHAILDSIQKATKAVLKAKGQVDAEIELKKVSEEASEATKDDDSRDPVETLLDDLSAGEESSVMPHWWDKIKGPVKTTLATHVADSVDHLKAMDPTAVVKQLAAKSMQVYMEELDKLASAGVAFAPKFNSNARKFGGSGTHDDDGCTILWRSDKFVAQSFSLKPIGTDANQGGKNDAAMLKVGLKTLDSKGHDKIIYVTTTHLSSGPEKEERRHAEVGDVRDMVLADSSSHPSIFAGDLNSDIFFDLAQRKCKCKGLKTNTFGLITGSFNKSFGETIDKGSKGSVALSKSTGWGLKSVWGSGTDPVPPTVIKMRGPGTAQPHKMGDFAFETIDHIFFNGLLQLQNVEVVGSEAWFKFSMELQRLLKRQGKFPGQVAYVADGVKKFLTADADAAHDDEYEGDDEAEDVTALDEGSGLEDDEIDPKVLALMDEQERLEAEATNLLMAVSKKPVTAELRALLKKLVPKNAAKIDLIADPQKLLKDMLKELFWRMLPSPTIPSDHFPVLATLKFA